MLAAVPAGETANGSFPDLAVATMVSIAANAEVGTNYMQVCARAESLLQLHPWASM